MAEYERRITLLVRLLGDLVPHLANSEQEEICKTLRSLYDRYSSLTPDISLRSSMRNQGKASALEQ